MNARESDMADLAAQDRAARAYSRQLSRHPDPRDPDWPGHAAELDSREKTQVAADNIELARDWCDRAMHAARDGRASDARRHLMEADELIQGLFADLKAMTGGTNG